MNVSHAAAWLLFLCLAPGSGAAQPTASTDVVARSLALHDPGGVWYQRAHRLQLRETRPEAEDRLTEVVLDYPAGLFVMTTVREGRRIEMRLQDEGGCVATLDGSTEIAEVDRKKYRLDCEGVAWWRGYQEYLYGLPMKIRDAGATLEAEAKTATFNGREALSVRVTYDPTVGGDVWYFYFDPTTFALVGARFYHDEAKNDGEYLYFEEQISAGGITLPRVRAWYYNSDDRYLAKDIIESYEQVPSGQN
ncbi:MAG: DUF6503 family protein [Rhodothermales bacterium]|nr:DUF6503 family protein [Rhodothermales bacterium]